jgi:hypothetical protein
MCAAPVCLPVCLPVCGSCRPSTSMPVTSRVHHHHLPLGARLRPPPAVPLPARSPPKSLPEAGEGWWGGWGGGITHARMHARLPSLASMHTPQCISLAIPTAHLVQSHDGALDDGAHNRRVDLQARVHAALGGLLGGVQGVGIQQRFAARAGGCWGCPAPPSLPPSKSAACSQARAQAGAGARGQAGVQRGVPARMRR